MHSSKTDVSLRKRATFHRQTSAKNSPDEVRQNQEENASDPGRGFSEKNLFEKGTRYVITDVMDIACCARAGHAVKKIFAGGENIQIVFLRKVGRNRPKRILHKKQTKQKQIICYQLQCSDTNTSTKFHFVFNFLFAHNSSLLLKVHKPPLDTIKNKRRMGPIDLCLRVR